MSALSALPPTRLPGRENLTSRVCSAAADRVSRAGLSARQVGPGVACGPGVHVVDDLRVVVGQQSELACLVVHEQERHLHQRVALPADAALSNPLQRFASGSALGWPRAWPGRRLGVRTMSSMPKLGRVLATGPPQGALWIDPSTQTSDRPGLEAIVLGVGADLLAGLGYGFF